MFQHVVYRVTIVWGMLFVMLFHFSHVLRATDKEHALSLHSCFACHMLVAIREFCNPDRLFCFVIDIDVDPCDLNVGGLVGMLWCCWFCPL